MKDTVIEEVQVALAESKKYEQVAIAAEALLQKMKEAGISTDDLKLQRLRERAWKDSASPPLVAKFGVDSLEFFLDMDKALLLMERLGFPPRESHKRLYTEQKEVFTKFLERKQ